jgi:hypothetical protein
MPEEGKGSRLLQGDRAVRVSNASLLPGARVANHPASLKMALAPWRV